MKPQPGITPNKEDKKDNSTGVVSTETGSVDNSVAPKSNVKVATPVKSVLPKTGLVHF